MYSSIGNSSLSTEDEGNSSVAIGHQALKNQNVDGEVHNVAIGRAAGKEITTGNLNTAVGLQSQAMSHDCTHPHAS